MRRLLTVARNTFIEALRTRVTAIFALTLLAGILVLPMASRQGTLLEQVQTFLAYSLGLTILLLSVLTLLLGCGLLCGEIRKRYIFTPMTKPVSRAQYLLGRWLGVVMLQALLCAGAGLGIYGMVRYMKERSADGDQKEALNNQLLVARAKHSPIPFNLETRVRARIEELSKENRLQGAIDAEGGDEQARQKVLQQIAAEVMVELQTAPPFGLLHWEFKDLRRPTGPDATIQFSFKLAPAVVPPDAKVTGAWRLENPVDNQPYFWFGEAPSRQQQTISLPAEVISSDGRLDVYYQNVNWQDPQNTFPTSVSIMADDVHILYPVGGFAANFVRGMLQIFCMQVFLASLAMAAGSFLSFPVASLVCFGLTTIGMGASFVRDSTNLDWAQGFWVLVGHYVSRGTLFLLPDFAAASPTDAIVGGLILPWTTVLMTAGTFILLQSTITLGIACLIFRRRELAEVTA